MSNEDERFKNLIAETRQERLARIKAALDERAQLINETARELIELDGEKPLSYDEMSALAESFNKAKAGNNAIRGVFAARIPGAVSDKIIEHHEKREDGE